MFRSSLSLLLVASLVVQPVSGSPIPIAQSAQDARWSHALTELAQTRTIVVALKTGEAVDRYFLGGDENGLTVLNQKTRTVEKLERSGIARITMVQKARRGTGKGAAIGFFSGLVLGALSVMVGCRDVSCDSQGGLGLFILPLFGWLLGTGFGALSGGGETRIVIYSS